MVKANVVAVQRPPPPHSPDVNVAADPAEDGDDEDGFVSDDDIVPGEISRPNEPGGPSSSSMFVTGFPCLSSLKRTSTSTAPSSNNKMSKII